MRDSISRRRFIQSTGAAGLGIAAMDLSAMKPDLAQQPGERAFNR